MELNNIKKYFLNFRDNVFLVLLETELALQPVPPQDSTLLVMYVLLVLTQEQPVIQLV
jgi:hypothetical protein